MLLNGLEFKGSVYKYISVSNQQELHYYDTMADAQTGWILICTVILITIIVYIAHHLTSLDGCEWYKDST